MSIVGTTHPCKNLPIRAQKGTVLIVVLLIVAVMSGIAVSFASDFQHSIARAQQRLYTGQLKQYWFSIEHFAVWGLSKDLEEDQQNNGKKPYDHLQELWSTVKVEAPLDAGFATATLEDAQSRFNLNVLSGRPEKFKANGSFVERFTVAQRRFIRLLQTNEDLGIDTAQAESITQAVIDWIDSDSDVSGLGGAESSYYSGLENAYRPANQNFVSTSELRLVKGVTPELYDYLKDLVIALPDSNAGINVNTAKLPIMRSITEQSAQEPLSVEDGNTMVAGRPSSPSESAEEEENQGVKITDGFKSVDEFFKDNDVASVIGTEQKLFPPQAGLTTGSNYFLLSSEVQVVESIRNGFSLLRRDASNNGRNRVVVVKRGTTGVL